MSLVGSILNLTNVDPTNAQHTIVLSFLFQRVSIRRREREREREHKRKENEKIETRLNRYEIGELRTK